MSKFKPPISERSTNELIEIIYLGEDSWKKEAIKQAEQELLKRRVSKQKQEKIIKQWERGANKHIVYLKKRRKKNKYLSYTKPEMFYIFLFAPFFVGRIWNTRGTFLKLETENFKLKYKQRFVLLVCGSLFWTILIIYQVYKPIKLTEKEEIEYQEWRKEFGYDK